MVKSWDIFDTLIARRCIDPKFVFTIVEEKSRFTNYQYYRILAERQSNGTFENIYQKFSLLTQCSLEISSELMDLELQTEKEQLFLIPETCNQVQDGDILVSDMYLPAETLHKILTYLGFQKKVKIFVSSGGKYNGWIWEEVRKQGFQVDLHTGDNRFSDVFQPRRYGIQTRHFGRTALLPAENYLQNNDQIELMRAIRHVRLNNPYMTTSYKYKMWIEQAMINIPLLYFASILLYDYIKERNITTLLFATRDGIHWHKMFGKMFPSYQIHYFHSSRNMFSNAFRDNNQHYSNYITRLIKDIDRTIYVDLHGTGTNVYKYFSNTFGNCPHVFIITVIKALQELSSQNKLFYVSQTYNDHLEMLNYDLIGTLQNFDNNGPVRDPVEYDLKPIRVYHNCVNTFLQNIPPSPKLKPGHALALCRYFIRASTQPLDGNGLVKPLLNHGLYIPIRHELLFLAYRFYKLIGNTS